MTGRQKKPKHPRRCRNCRCRHRRCCRRHCYCQCHQDSERSFAKYFPPLLNKVHHGLKLSQDMVRTMDSFVNDMFERIASESGRLARNTNRRTMSTRDIQTAVRLILPEILGKLAVNQATRALHRFTENK